jgi:hypothetical protein
MASARRPFYTNPSVSRHGRTCPGHPDDVKRRGHLIEITGTRPVMTGDYRFLPYFAGNA